MSDEEAIYYRVRECYVRKDNLRVSSVWMPNTPAYKAVVIESVHVHESMRRQGVFTRFLRKLCQTPGIDLFIVEGVGNAHLADALMRWDWDFDPVVMDFYKFAEPTT